MIEQEATPVFAAAAQHGREGNAKHVGHPPPWANRADPDIRLGEQACSETQMTENWRAFTEACEFQLQDLSPGGFLAEVAWMEGCWSKLAYGPAGWGPEGLEEFRAGCSPQGRCRPIPPGLRDRWCGRLGRCRRRSARSPLQPRHSLLPQGLAGGGFRVTGSLLAHCIQVRGLGTPQPARR